MKKDVKTRTENGSEARRLMKNDARFIDIKSV